MNAPLVEWIGMGRIYGEINSLSRIISLMEKKTTKYQRSAYWLTCSGDPGFRESPDGFSVDCYPLDADHLVEGLVPQ